MPMSPIQSRPLARMILLLLAAPLFFFACEAPPREPEEEEDDPIASACYHFELSGHLDQSATCRDYNISPNPRGGLTITLLQPPVALFLEIPETLALGQYEILSRQKALEAGTAIGAEVLYNPLDGQEEHFNVDVSGKITIIRFDETGISALFRFQADPRSPAAPEGIQVQGHLRDLPLQRN